MDQVDPAPAPRHWAWTNGEDQFTVDYDGRAITWSSLFYDVRLGDFTNPSQTQTVDDFLTFGPVEAAPPAVVAELAAHLGLTDPRWSRPLEAGVDQLIKAAQTGRTDDIRTLVVAGVDIESADVHGYTALWWALARHHAETALWLISVGADVRRRYRHNGDAVQVAAMSADPAVLRALLDAGADASGFDSIGGDNALTTAIRQGRPAEVVQILVDAGVDVNWQPKGRPTPLTLAAKLGRSDLVSILEQAGAKNSAF